MVRPYLKNTEMLLQVSWGQTLNWDVRFDSAPAPFNRWFPAHILDRQVVSIEKMDIKGPVIATAIPAGEESRELTLQFYDDDQDTLRNWLVDWMAEMSMNGLAIATVKEACRIIYISHLDRTGDLTTFSALHVFPYGRLQETFNSGTSNAVKGYSISFVIAGAAGGARTGTEDDSNVGADGLTKTLTPAQQTATSQPIPVKPSSKPGNSV